MKKKRHLFQKYQKKYLFFQKSFFDFLYWRSTKNLNSHSIFEKQFHSFQNLYPFEQEKICFYEYWKSSENQKTKNTFQNSPKFKKQFFRKDKKIRNSFENSKKSFHFLTSQKFHLLFLKKRKEKFMNIQKKNFVQTFKNENILPKNSSSEIFQNFQFFESQKIGDFFPKKKNFQQYWIFPFLGVLFFFSQNSSFLFFQKEKNSQKFFSFDLFQIDEREIVADLLSQNNQVFGKRKKFLNFQKNDKNHIQTVDEFSFSEKNITPFFQNIEKNEYEEFLKFSTKIFQNTLSSFPLVENKKNSLNIKEKMYLQKTFVLQQSFQKKLETNRNSFNWKWFSLNSKRINFILPKYQIPQKAEFFRTNPLNFQNFSSSLYEQKSAFIEEKKKSSTPLFDYSKSLFLVDELKRKFSFLNTSEFFSSSVFNKIDESDWKNQKSTVFFLKKSEEMQKFFLRTADHEYFLTPEQKEEFLFYNSFFSNSLNTNSINSSFFNSENNKELTHQEKNLFFLKKWAKIQKISIFLNLQKNQNAFMRPVSFKKSENFSSFDQTKRYKSQIKKQFIEKPKYFEKFFHLDSIYFQKLFKNFQKQKVQNKYEAQSFRDAKNNENQRFQHFFNFKKKTFHFLTFQHCNQNYKKFLNSFFYKIQKSKHSIFLFHKVKENKFSLKTNFEKKKIFQKIHFLSFFPKTERIRGKKIHDFSLFLKNRKEKNFSFLDKILFSENFQEKYFRKKNSIFHFHQPILFQFSQKEKTFQKLSPKNFMTFFTEKNLLLTQKKNSQKFAFQTNFTLSPQNFYRQKFNSFFFPNFEKTKTFSLHGAGQFKNFNFFENFQEKLFENFMKSFFLNISKFENFQKSFLFETSQVQKVFLFQKKNTLWTIPNSTGEKEKRSYISKNFQKQKTSQVFLLKSKKKFSFLQYQNQKENILSSFSGLSKKQKKFEKVFRAFFSPLKYTKNSFVFREQKKEKFFSEKTKKDLIFLQNLSTVLKKNSQFSSFSFFIPPHKKQAEGNIFEKEYKMFFHPHSFQKEAKILKNFQTSFQKNRLSPELVLKRDGFLFISSSQNSSKTKNSSTFQRLEKEKIFQKKRRLKKEKLETRRRKKRKRFFPRPVWLRMNLYKKFLKIRHSQKLFGSSSFQKYKEISKKNTFQKISKSILPSPLSIQNQPSFFEIDKIHFKNWFQFISFDQKFVEKKGKWFQKMEEKQLNKYFLKKFQSAEQVKTNSDFHIYDVDSVFFKKQNQTFQSKTYQKNYQKKNWRNEKNDSKKSFSFNFDLLGENSISKNKNEFISKNIEQYKISDEIFQEFLRLSWKSSWFQNNFKPYTQKIEKNFEKIQSIESQKNDINIFESFKNKNICFCFHNFPVFCEQSQNDFLVRKSVLQKFSWYSKIPNAFSFRGETNLIKKNYKNFASILDSEKNQKISEYNRILYVRISDILKKFKFSENMTNDFFFENFKVYRRKNEKIFSGSNNSFFTKTALFFEKFQVPSEPVIPAFSVFSSLFNDFSIKPTGDIPTLRALWAFQKTNYSHFQERNNVQNLWAFKKRKDIFHSFKGTKKMMNFLRKYNGFENLKTPKEFSSIDFNFSPSFKRYVFQDRKLSFLASKKNDFFHPLDTMTFKKFQNIEKKSSMFGIQSFQQNSRISYRYFKFHLSSAFQNQKKFSFSSNQMKQQQILPVFSVNFFKNKNFQNSAKSSLNFWWAQQPFQNFDYLQTSQFENSHEFSKKKMIFFDKNEFLSNIFSEKLTLSEIEGKGKKNENFLFSEDQLNFSSQFILHSGFLIFGAFFFHFAIFYTLFKIPEIRSVFKFTLLVFSKFLKSFFFVFFSIYNIFKQYTKNGLNLFKNSSSFTEKKTFESHSLMNLKTTQSIQSNPAFEETKNSRFFNLENNFFSSNNCLHKMDFQIYLFQKKQKNQNQKNFENFVFEFFPRFSSSHQGQKEFLKDSFFQFDENFQKEFKNEQFWYKSNVSMKTSKNSFKEQKTSLFFQKQKNQSKKNLKEFCFQLKGVEYFDSALLFKLSPKNFANGPAFSNFSFFENNSGFFVPQKRVSFKTEKTFLNLSKVEKNLSQFALSFLLFSKNFVFIPYHFFKIGSSVFTKIFEIFESIFYAFYKFFEKPAEFMIEFIAFVFLIEWSSDLLTFIPDTIESSMWKSSQKLLRPVRTGTFFLSFGIFFIGSSVHNLNKGSQFVFQTGQNFSIISPFHFLVSTGFFNFSNFLAYVLQKRLLYIFEHFPSILLQPDIDIFVRQRKGILFWDIWAEILLKAAEKYNVNLPSFVTLKEEQELFIEKLVRDSQFFENIYGVQTKNFQKENGVGENTSIQSFSSFLQNFVIQNRPRSLFDFYFSSQKELSVNSSFFQKGKSEKLQQFTISNLFLSSFLQQSSQNFSSDEKQKFQFNKIQEPQSFEIEKMKNRSFYLSKKPVFFQNFSNIFNFDSNFLLKNQTKNENFFPFFMNFSSFKNFQQLSIEKNFSHFQNFKKISPWEFHQYATFQSQETDFFLDIYPPKSLKHVHFLKYYEPAHYTLGSLICQIYAGIFSKQVSKNILVLGESGTAKTFFLRALAGETEMKIITENASRYAMVQRGVAVGMKYLRDVFDAIALQTPCFFVMEDLHIIGSKRPFMISENENNQNSQSSFGLEQQEVHETNQMIYQSTRHSVSDFRRPYKGDFSMGIPTNFFLQTFYSPFFSPQRGPSKNRSSLQHRQIADGNQDSFFYPIRKGHIFQNSQFFGGNFSSSVSHSLSSPLPIDSLDISFQNSGIQEKEINNFESFSSQKHMKKIQSWLQFSKEQIFAPPATSPFTVLMMKEQKKLKPKKIVQEISWGGLSADQILLYQKESSSIRAKVSVLAEKTMNLSRGKFDMITDFLVIIDSVRSNRGFVVFGTTHKPSSLDPALRRPGRFDETLSLARNPNFLNRFEIFKMNLENSLSTFDFFDSTILTENFSEMDLFDILSQTKLSFFHNYKYNSQKFVLSNNNSNSNFIPELKNSHVDEKIKKYESFTIQKQLYSQISPGKAFHALLKSPIFEDFYSQKQFTSPFLKGLISSNFASQKNPSQNENIFFGQKYTIFPNGPSHILSLAYSKLGIFLAEANLLNDPNCYIPLNLDLEKNSSKYSNFQQFYGNVFYDSKKQRNLQLMVFLSGKIAEFLSQKNLFLSFVSMNQNLAAFGKNSLLFGLPEKNFLPQNIVLPFNTKDKIQFDLKTSKGDFQEFSKNSSFIKGNFLFEKPQFFFSTKFTIFESSFQNFEKSKNKKYQKNSSITKMNFFYTEQKNPSFSSVLNASPKFEFFQKNFYWTVYGNEESWRSATPFLFSLIQKRFLFTKNLFLSKMFFFENMDQRRKPPSPPGSSIFMPSKKYENFKRVEADFFQKAHFSIHEKIQMHQKQRFLKQLYNIPVQKYFRSELRKNHKTLFSSSFQEFAYLDLFIEKTSSSHSYYKKYIQVRHRFSNVNQWWNGMFPEHTREATYLSDVDWRTMFVTSTDTLNSINKVDGKINPEYKFLFQRKNSEIQNDFSNMGMEESFIQNQKKNFKKSSNETFEFLMDFPDTEQYYNPRNRRWFFKSNANFENFHFKDSDFYSFSQGEYNQNFDKEKFKNSQENFAKNSTFWSLFEKDLQYEIFSHFLMESFYQSFSYFDKKREMLDFFVFQLLHKGFLKEFDFLTTFSRF